MKQSKRTRSRRKGGAGNPSGNDIPARPKRTYETISCPFPRKSDTVTVHSQAVATQSASASANGFTTYTFSIANGNLSTGTFDQYRIKAVRFSVLPQNNAIGLVTNSTTTLVPFLCVIDYDDASALGSAAAAEAYSNCVTLAPGESCSRVFCPRMAVAAYNGAFTGFANMEPQWIDAAYATVQHYGIKTWVPAATAGQTNLQTWQIIVEYAVELRANI
jgi:hypothetical protein